MANKEFISVAEAAEMLSVNTESVYRWLRSGKLPGKKVGGRLWRIRRAALDQLINQK